MESKWALGITDTLAVGLLCEYTGLRVPIVAFPATGRTSSFCEKRESVETVMMQIAEEAQSIVSGDRVIVPMQTMHVLTNTGDAEMKFICFGVKALPQGI